MGQRYAIRLDTEGWTVFDSLSDRAVLKNGRKQEGLSFDEADDLAERLNRQSFTEDGARRHSAQVSR